MENVRIQPRHHPRCGTSFLFVVIFVSILVSSVVFGIWPITNVWLRTLAHLLLLPLVVGITYEFNRWVGRHVQDSRLAKILTAPGMWMQNFTTNEPDDSMIECAIRSLELVLPSEKGKGRVVNVGGGERADTVAALRFPALFGPPIAPLPRNSLPFSAAGGGSAVSLPTTTSLHPMGTSAPLSAAWARTGERRPRRLARYHTAGSAEVRSSGPRLGQSIFGRRRR